MGSVDNCPTNFLANIPYRLLQLKSVIRVYEMRAPLILAVVPFDFGSHPGK